MKSIRFDLEYRFQVLLGKRGVVICKVIGCVGVLASTRLGDDLVVLLRWIFGGSAEHHVLKKMSEAGFSRFELVARAGLDWNLYRNHVRKAGPHDDHLQAVGQGLFGGLERQDVARRGRAGKRGATDEQRENDGGRKLESSHPRSFAAIALSVQEKQDLTFSATTRLTVGASSGCARSRRMSQWVRAAGGTPDTAARQLLHRFDQILSFSPHFRHAVVGGNGNLNLSSTCRRRGV